MDQATPSNFYLTICLYVSFYFLFFTSTSHQLNIVPPTDQELNETRRAQSASEQLDPFLAATRQAKASRQVRSIAKARAKRTVDTVRGYHSRQHSKQQYQHHSRGNTSSSSAGDKQHHLHQQQHPFFFQNRHLRQHSRQKSQGTRHYPTVTTLFEIPGRYHFEDPSLFPPPPSSFPPSSSPRLANTTPSSSYNNYNLNNNNSSTNIFFGSSPLNGNNLTFTPDALYQEYNDNPAHSGYFWRTTNTNNHNHYNTLTSPSAGLDFQLLQYHTARERTRLYHQHQLQQHYYTPPFLPTDSPSSFKKQSKQQQQQPTQQLQYTSATAALSPSGVERGQQPQKAGKASTSIEIQLRPQLYKPPQKHLRIFPRQNQNRYYHFYPDPIFRKKMTVSTTPEPTTAATATATATMVMSTNSSLPNTPALAPVASSGVVESSYSSSASSATVTPIVAGAATAIVEATTPAVEIGIQVQQQQQQHQPRTTIGWAEGNHSLNGQSASTIPRLSSSQVGSVQAQLGQGQPHIHHQGTTTTTTGASNTSFSTAPLTNGSNNNNTNFNGAATGGGTTRTRYESTCHLEESVAPPTLLAHLRLLRLVQSLVIVEDEDLDFLFLIRSEERYLMYLDLLQQLQPPPHAVPLPPLDVALMWTVHMLAPFRYHEDLLRSYSPNLLNYAFPLERYVAAVDIEDPTTAHDAFQPSKEMWYQLYPEEAFDLDKEDTTRMFDIQCLWCGGTNVMDSSTYIKFRIDGMSIDCAGCGSQCSLETLSSKRLWDGIEAFRADSSIFLAGSLLSPWTGTPDPEAAQREHVHLFYHPRIQFGLDQSAASLNCTWSKVIQTFQELGPDQYYGVRPTTLARIISSYMGLVEDRLSIDLVAGALRQRDFQKAMMVTGGLAWCQPQVLQRTLDRYKKFMLLAKAESRQTDGSHTVSGPGLGAGQPGRHALVPTLDIDLAWHTHMLSPAHYRHFQLVHYGRVLNHDDTVQATSTMTKQDFVRTADLWQELYQERYSSQQTWKSRFVVTPQKVCAGVCFPPYGVYLVWKSWKSKRKAKKLNRESGNGSQKVKKSKEKKESKKHKLALKTKVSEEATVVEAEGAPPKNIHSGTMEKDPELQMEELAVAQEEEDLEPPAQGYDTKGKGKVENGYHHATNGDHDLTNGAGIRQTPSQQQQGVGVGDTTNRNLTPALGLDGRLSNWNGDTTGPDGQASCASGACIMSPWNELQDMMPYLDLPPPQQQRELRRERT